MSATRPTRLSILELNRPYRERDLEFSGYERKGTITRDDQSLIRFDRGTSTIYLGFLLGSEHYVFLERYDLSTATHEKHKGDIISLESVTGEKASV